MLDKLRFVTLFPPGENVHLIKDVGQIPYHLYKYYGTESVLVSNGIRGNGPYIEETRGLKFASTARIWGRSRLAEFTYLLMHARNIDWLNLYHVNNRNFMGAKIYRLFNPKGRIYLKLDIGPKMCDLIQQDIKARERFVKCVEYMDIVSAETSLAIECIQPYTTKRIEQIPNGFMLDEREMDFDQKENIFLTVGRLGTEPKATEVLLEAYAACAKEIDWDLELVGTIEESFEPYIESFFQKYPEVKHRVKFLGEINDRAKLADIYRRARAFVLPSRWESFALVLAEAASQGCKLIVTSSVLSCKDFVVDNRFGRIVEPDNVGQLAEAMRQIAGEVFDTAEVMSIREHTLEQFSWERIIEKLYKCMMEAGTR